MQTLCLSRHKEISSYAHVLSDLIDITLSSHGFFERGGLQNEEQCSVDTEKTKSLILL